LDDVMGNIRQALAAGGLTLATVLVAKGADVNSVGNYGGNRSTPLWWASRAVCNGAAEALELATLLVANGAGVNAVGAERARLLERGADVDAVGKWSTRSGSASGTPLRWAAEAVRDGAAGGTELAILLSSAGASLAESEKEEFQGIIDGVTGKRKSMHDEGPGL